MFYVLRVGLNLLNQACNDIDLDLVGLMKSQAEKQLGDEIHYGCQIFEGMQTLLVRDKRLLRRSYDGGDRN